MGSKFSVIVPVYNVEKYLEKCIQSVLAQAYYNFELILVDNNSTDGSRAICDKYAKLDERIKVIEEKKQGPSCARNAGLDIATGEYVCFIDSDDYVEKEHLLKNAYQLEKGYDICSFCARREDENYKYLYEMRFDEAIKSIDFNKCDIDEVICNTFLQYKAGWEACFSTYRISLLKDNNIRFDEGVKYAEDLVFTIKCLTYADKWIKIPDVLYNYVYRDGAMTSAVHNSSLQKGEKLVKEMEKVCDAFIVMVKDKDDITKNMYFAAFMNRIKKEKFAGISLDEYRKYMMQIKPVTQKIISYKHIKKQKKYLIKYFGKEEGFELYNRYAYLNDGSMFRYKVRRKIQRVSNKISGRIFA